MCAVIFPFIRRLFSSFVLTCFSCTTLFQTIAFANFTRAGADPAYIKSRNGFHYAHFSVGAQKMEGYPLSKGNAHDTHILPAKAPTLIIPIGKSLKHPELLFEKAFYEWDDITPTTVDDGLSWIFDGLDCYRENISGDLVISKHDSSLHSPSTPIELSNHHGSTILDGDLPYEHLVVSGKDVIQRGKQVIESLLLRIQGTFVNTNFLSVGRLSFDSSMQDVSTSATSRESSRASSPAPSLDSDDSTASSHSIGFLNEDTLTVREETTFGLLEPISNTGKMTFERDVIFLDDVLSNKTERSIFECHQKLQGTLRELSNEGNLHVRKGFDALHIRQFINEGNIHGSGHLIVGSRDQVAINTGVLHVEQLMLDLAGDFNNNGTIQADEILRTHGESTFHQSGTLSGKAIVINNAAFENEHEIDSSSLDLSFGDQVATFHNHEKIVLRTKSLTFSASTELKTSAINDGDLVTERFSNARDTFINRDHITATSWDQHGKAFTNEFGGTIDVVRESLFDTDQIENTGDMTLGAASGRIDQLINAGGFTVQRGGFKAKTIRNKKKMELLDGEYHIDHLDNKGGEATIDQLSLMSESPTLEGKLAVNYFKPTSAEYKRIHIDGDVTLKSGEFKTKELVIKGSLSLGKGHYHIDVLKGDKGAKLLLQSGARITIGDTEYDGDIVPEVNLELNPFQEKDTSYKAQLREDHSIRKTAFNAIPTATPVKKPILEETVFTKSKSIVDAQSDYNRIDPNKKGCDLTEAKSRLQATIGTEITRLIHSAVKKDEIDFQKTLPVLPTTDRLYGHFEIFRHTSSAARDIVQKITTDGMDILDSLSFYVPSFESDFNIIKQYRYDLTRDMFMLWLREVLDEHDEGFTPYKFLKPRELPPVPLPESIQKKGPFQTFKAPHSQPGSITDLLQNSAKREADFNGLSTEKATKHPLLQNSVLTASTNILGILGQVSSRQATDDERKNVLQTVMGSQITRVIHEEKEQQAIDLETHLPTVEKSHWSYRHFEILRLTAKLSRTLVQQVAGHGYDALSYVTALIPDFELDTDTLCTYSGIKRDMFMLWFKEILEQHEEGFTYSTRASLTFLSKASSRGGTIRTGKHVFLKAAPASPPEWAANFLREHKDTLRIDVKSGLTLETDTFLNTHELDLPYPLYLTRNFINQGILRTKGLFHVGTTFQNGIDNEHMGTIECDGPMNIYMKHDVDLRFGILQSTKRGFIQSQQGNILIGARKNLDGNGRVTQKDSDAITVVKNGAIVSSNEELILKVLQRSIINHFGVAHGGTNLHYIGPKLENISAEGTSDGEIIVDVDDFDHLILNEIYHYGTGRSGADGGTQNVYSHSSYRGFFGREVKHYKDVSTYSSISGQKAKAESSLLSAKGNIIINSKKPPTVFASHFASNKSILWRHADGYLEAVPNGVMGVAELTSKQVASFQSLSLHDYFTSNSRNAGIGNGCIVPTFASAEGLLIDFPFFNLLFEAAASAQHIVMTAHGLQIRNGSGFRKPTQQATRLFPMKQAANTLLTSALTKKTIDGKTTHYTRNVPGKMQPAPELARFPISIKNNRGVLRSLSSPHTAFSPLPPAVFDCLFDLPTLDQLIMHGQLAYTGRIHKRGAGFTAYCVQNGHTMAALAQKLLDSGVEVDELLLLQSKEPAIVCLPMQTQNGVTNYHVHGVFPSDMQMRYHETSGNIQASDRVELLMDAGGVHMVDGTIGSGSGGTQIATANNGDFTATSVSGVRTLLESQDAITVDIDGSFTGEAVQFHVSKNKPINITVKDHMILIPKIKRQNTGNGFQDVLTLCEFKGGDIFINAEGVLDVTAIMMDAENTIRLSAKQIIDRQALLYWQSHSIMQTDDGSISIHSQGSNATVSRYIAREHIVLESDSTIDVFGTFFKSKLIQLLAEDDVRVHDVQDTVETSITQKSEDDSLLGGTTTTHSSSASSMSKRAVFDGKLQVVTLRGNVDFRNIDARNGIDVIAPNGVVRFLLGENTSQSSFQEQSKDVLWQSLSYEMRNDKTYSQSRIQGIIHIVSKETVVQDVQGQTAEFLARIEQDGGKITREFLAEVHERMADEKGGPTATFAIIIAIAASVCTAGAGGVVAGALVSNGIIAAGGLAATAVTTIAGAGITSLTTQAALALVTHQGDIFKAGESLANSGTLKTVATEMALSALVGTPSSGSSIGTHVMHQVRSSFIRMGVEGAIHGRTDRKAWFKKAMIDGAAAYATSNVGAMNRAATIDQVSHKIAHSFIQGMKGKLMYGNKAIAPSAIGGFVSECIAEFMMPTHGVDHLSSNERPHYTPKQQAIVHGIAKMAPVLICAACGMDDAQIAIAVQSATMALTYNHGQSVDEARKKKGEAQREEEEEEKAPALTIGGTEFDVVDHVDNHPGRRKRSLSLTSLYLLDQKTHAEAEWSQADGIWNKYHAKVKVDLMQDALDHRTVYRAGVNAKEYAIQNPGKATAYAGAALLSGGSVFAPTLGTGMFLGAAGGFVGSMASHDLTINTPKDAASVAISTALGGLIPAPAKLFFPAAVATGVYGMNTNDPDLMWEGGLGAAFSFVPLVKEARHRFNTAQNVTAGSAHFTRSLDDLMVRPPVNVNHPVRPTANYNRMSLAHALTEASNAQSMQHLAQKMSVGSSAGSSHIAAADIDFRRIYMSSKPSAIGGSHIGSSKSATQSTLDSIAGKSAGESLTLDGSGRTFRESGKLTLTNTGKDSSGRLLVFRQNEEGRVILSVGEKVSAEDLLRRPMSLQETTARTLEKWEKVKAARATSIQQHIDQVTGVDRASARTQLFGTDNVTIIDGQRVRTINGTKPHNHALAGKTYYFDNVKDSVLKRELQNKYPHGVPFTGTGHPDFSRYAIKKVQINVTGKNGIDFNAANKAAGFKETPEGFTWHHHHDAKSMQLVPSDLHAREAVPHTGGAAIIKAIKGESS